MIYVMSDIHGHLEEFKEAIKSVDLKNDNQLILLGDYIDFGPESEGVCRLIMKLQNVYGKRKIIALKGNHEFDYIENHIHEEKFSIDIVNWMSNLPLYYESKNYIFVHAGINELYDDFKDEPVFEYTLVGKYPPTVGRYHKTIVAGHTSSKSLYEHNLNIGTYEKGIYHDGMSHYYIDGSFEKPFFIPVLILEN